jgi:hypothetical protein
MATTTRPARSHSEAAYRLGSDRGSQNHGNTLLSKRMTAQMRPQVRVRTKRPVPWRMPVGARRYARTPADRWLASARGQLSCPSGDAGEEARHDVAARYARGIGNRLPLSLGSLRGLHSIRILLFVTVACEELNHFLLEVSDKVFRRYVPKLLLSYPLQFRVI